MATAPPAKRGRTGSRRAIRSRQPTLQIAADGRVRRAQRSGEAIVEAVLALIGEGVLEPTAQQVARRANLGIRTVFRRFSDMESLLAEVDARIEVDAAPLLIRGTPQGDLSERSRAFVSQRATFFERIAPFKRAGNLKRWRSAFLRDRHARLVRVLRSELLRWMPELTKAPAALADAAREAGLSF